MAGIPDRKPIAWITGAGGLIGNCLVESARSHAPDWRVLGLTRHELDLTDFESLRRHFDRDQPQLVIHCAAMSKSQQCEADPRRAWTVNAEATRQLADLAKGIPFVFFSSDLVFDGKKGNYVEADAPNPLTVYGETKVAAEETVLTNPLHTVIRTSLTYGCSPSGDRAFNEELRNLWERGETPRLFMDEFRCPIPAEVTARAVWELVAKGARGLYHLAGSERLSRLRIGQLIASQYSQLHPRIEPGSLRDFRGAARSPDTSMNCSKVQELLSFRLPAFTTLFSGQ